MFPSSKTFYIETNTWKDEETDNFTIERIHKSPGAHIGGIMCPWI